MKIAVTYAHGNVFQHFGHTEWFKIFSVEDGKVTGSEMCSSGGAGHGALADFLAGSGVDLLICGGIGGGARKALEEAGIELVPGAEGRVDEVVDAYLAGTLETTDGTCNHHGEGHTCGEHEEGHDCGGHCH